MRALPRALVAVVLLGSAGCGVDRPGYPPPGDATSTGAGGAGAGGSGGGGTDVVAGPVISENPVATWEAETHLAVAPDGRVMAVWIASQLGGGSFIGYAWSTDRGGTWAPAALVPTDPDAVAADPAVVVDVGGVFHLVWLELPSGGARRIKTAAYLEAGDTFSIPVEVTDAAAPAQWDKPWILALADGQLLITWGTESGSTLTAARSQDGQAWQRGAFAPDGMLRNVALPCAAGGGRVYLSYLVPGGVEVARSDDAGAAWTKPVRADGPGEAVAFEAPSCVAAGDDVWVVYGTSPDASSKAQTPLLDAVIIAHSKDGGLSFPDRHVVADPIGAGSLLPFLSRAPGGRIDLVYYRGKAAGDPHAALRWVRGAFGMTWSEPHTLHAPVVLETARKGLGWLGDYVGVQSADDAVFVTFADVSGASTLSHVRFGMAPVL